MIRQNPTAPQSHKDQHLLNQAHPNLPIVEDCQCFEGLNHLKTVSYYCSKKASHYSYSKTLYCSKTISNPSLSYYYSLIQKRGFSLPFYDLADLKCHFTAMNKTSSFSNFQGAIAAHCFVYSIHIEILHPD